MSVDEATAYTERLLGMTDDQYTQDMSLWEQKQQAAKQVAESMKASLPVPKECHHEFPPEFERDMKRLAAQTERRRHMRRYLQRVAAACLAVVSSVSTGLSVDAEARAAFVQWVKTCLVYTSGPWAVIQ